jgi:hypothetical protein
MAAIDKRSGSSLGDIEPLLREFTTRLMEIIERSTIERIRDGLASFEAAGRIPEVRRRGPLTCPIEGCGKPAAPRWGFVCWEHKELPEREKRSYREAAKAAKRAARGGPAARAALTAAPAVADSTSRRKAGRKRRSHAN